MTTLCAKAIRQMGNGMASKGPSYFPNRTPLRLNWAVIIWLFKWCIVGILCCVNNMQMTMSINGSCGLVAKDGMSMRAIRKRSHPLSIRDYRHQRSAAMLYCNFHWRFTSVVFLILSANYVVFLLSLYLFTWPGFVRIIMFVGLHKWCVIKYIRCYHTVH